MKKKTSIEIIRYCKLAATNEKKTAIKQATFPVNDKPKTPKHSIHIVNVFFRIQFMILHLVHNFEST